MSMYVIRQIKLPKVLNDAINEYCKRKHLDFYEWTIAIWTYKLLFGSDRRGFKKAMEGWEEMNRKY